MDCKTSIIIQNECFYLLFFLRSDAGTLIGYHILYNFTIFDIKCSQIKWNIWTMKDEETEYELVTWKPAWPLKAGVLLSFFFYFLELDTHRANYYTRAM